MKTISKPLMVLSLVSLMAVTGCGNSPEAEKTKQDAQAAGDKIADTAKDVAAQTVVLATNVASHVEEATTNAVSEVKAKIDGVTH
jgi:hypothetical protein